MMKSVVGMLCCSLASRSQRSVAVTMKTRKRRECRNAGRGCRSQGGVALDCRSAAAAPRAPSALMLARSRSCCDDCGKNRACRISARHCTITSESIRAAEPASPFTARLIECLAADVDADGPVAALVATGHAHRARTLPCACVERCTPQRSARDPSLAAAYPARNPDWDETVWLIARLPREATWYATSSAHPHRPTKPAARSHSSPASCTSRPNTPDRSTFWRSRRCRPQPPLDRFRYRTSWAGAQTDSSVSIETQWTGPPRRSQLQSKSGNRAACDLNPLDITDPSNASGCARTSG
jgi:hypothetical protein